MKELLLASAILTALIIPLAATADHRPGHEKGPGNANLSIKADPHTVLWARATTISGKLRGNDNAGKTIELQHNPHPFSGPFRRVATTMTDANGDYSFRVVPAEHTNYRVEARVSPRQTSAERTVRVRMRINRRVSDRTPARGERVTFSGRVAPAHDGRIVLLQRRRPSGSWKTVARATLVDAGADEPNNSFWQRSKRITRDGVFRARIRAHDDHLGNTTRRVRLNVP